MTGLEKLAILVMTLTIFAGGCMMMVGSVSAEEVDANVTGDEHQYDSLQVSSNDEGSTDPGSFNVTFSVNSSSSDLTYSKTEVLVFEAGNTNDAIVADESQNEADTITFSGTNFGSGNQYDVLVRAYTEKGSNFDVGQYRITHTYDDGNSNNSSDAETVDVDLSTSVSNLNVVRESLSEHLTGDTIEVNATYNSENTSATDTYVFLDRKNNANRTVASASGNTVSSSYTFQDVDRSTLTITAVDDYGTNYTLYVSNVDVYTEYEYFVSIDVFDNESDYQYEAAKVALREGANTNVTATVTVTDGFGQNQRGVIFSENLNEIEEGTQYDDGSAYVIDTEGNRTSLGDSWRVESIESQTSNESTSNLSLKSYQRSDIEQQDSLLIELWAQIDSLQNEGVISNASTDTQTNGGGSLGDDISSDQIMKTVGIALVIYIIKRIWNS